MKQELCMYADWGAESPIWDQHGDMVWLDSLPIDAELRQSLESWAAKYDEMWDEDDWNEEGKRLCTAVGESLGDAYVITWKGRD